MQPLELRPLETDVPFSLDSDDLGLLYGVVIVDRLRTVNAIALDAAEHLDRFQHSCQEVGIELPSQPVLLNKLETCVAGQRGTFDGRDFSVVMLATPGKVGRAPGECTLIFYAMGIPWKRWQACYQWGQALALSSHCNVPAVCWSPQIKTRARLHYYLADREAVRITQDPHAAGVLLDTHGFLTETSSANLLVVEGRRLVSPRPEKILDGISLRRTIRLAKRLGLQVGWEDIGAERARNSDAILLCGSTGCLWPASRFDDRRFDNATHMPVFVDLAQAWNEELGVDYMAQAKELARLA